MGKLDIDTDYIAKLAELLQRTGLTEIEIAQADTRIRVARQIQAHIDVAAPAAPLAAAAGPAAPVETAAVESNHPGVVTSPMVGTAYLAPEPGAAPFVAVGQEVREGATLLIIEAMKVMNQIRAPRAGRVARIFVENAGPVEYGEPLLIIE
jgi:acetyl-CoA carboxylase biotin carboxyl carrier protein